MSHTSIHAYYSVFQCSSCTLSVLFIHSYFYYNVPMTVYSYGIFVYVSVCVFQCVFSLCVKLLLYHVCFVCKQTLRHTAVSVLQIPVWCLNIHRTPVRYATLCHIRYASGARPDGAWCITCQPDRPLIGTSGAKRSFTLSRRHSLCLRCSVVDCITLCYIGLLDI